MRCLWLFHRWVRLKWGSSLDCRECPRCGRFEVYAFGAWRKAPREPYEPTRPA